MLGRTHIGTGSVSNGRNGKGLMAQIHEANDLGIVYRASNHRHGNNSNHDNIDGNNTTTPFHCESFKASIIYAALGSETTKPTSTSSITSPPAPLQRLLSHPVTSPPPTYTTPAFLGTRSLHLQLNPTRFKLYNHTSHHPQIPKTK